MRLGKSTDRKKIVPKKRKLTGIRLNDELARGSFHQVRLDAGVVDTPSRQNGLNAARLRGLVGDVHCDRERLTDVDSLEIYKIELDVLLSGTGHRVVPLRRFGASHGSVQGQPLVFGTFDNVK